MSNIFMTTAWYWHLKETNISLWKAIVISWCVAFFEYCLTVPANRLGYTAGWNVFQLKNKGITHIAMTPRFNPAASLY